MTPATRRLLVAVIAAIAVGGAGYWVGSVGARSMGGTLRGAGRLPPWGLPAAAAMTIGLAFAAIALHELGHVIAGRLAGCRFVLWAAGPLMVYRRGGRLRPAYNSSPAFWGGVSASIPPDEEDVRRKMLAVVLGGPLASLAAAAACGAAVFLLSGWAAIAAAIAAGLSGVIGLVTLIPSRGGQMFSDGARALQLIRGDEQGKTWCDDAVVWGLLAGGVRPRDLPAALVKRLEGRADSSAAGHPGAVFALYRRSLDAGDPPSAREWLGRLDAARDQWPKPFQSLIDLETAWMLAVEGGDAAEARARFSNAEGNPFIERGSKLRVEAAVLALEGRADESARAAAEARHELETGFEQGVAIAERDWIDRYVSR